MRFLVKNTLLDNSHIERFDTVCTPFPMERHNYSRVKREFNQSKLRFLVKNTLLNNSHLERFTFFEACINLKKSFVLFFLWNVTFVKRCKKQLASVPFSHLIFENYQKTF